MRFVDDQDLSFCMTISSGIPRDVLLDVLGKVEQLPVPQAFDDFAEDTHKPGRAGLLNVFEDEEFLITLENNGYSGARRSTVSQIATATTGKIGHYACILRDGNGGYQYYTEVQDGMVLAIFDPMVDRVPDVVEEFFPSGGDTVAGMIKALEYRMETVVEEKWLSQPTDTCLIDYQLRRN